MLKEAVRQGMEGSRLANQAVPTPTGRTVYAAMGDMHAELESLDKAVTALADALRPVLVNAEPPQNGCEQSVDKSLRCPLTSAIDEATDKVRYQRDEIVAILTNLNIG